MTENAGPDEGVNRGVRGDANQNKLNVATSGSAEKKPGFWKRFGNAAMELIGSFLYQGPR